MDEKSLELTKTKEIQFREIQKIEKKIKILKRIYIIGVILVIINCCLIPFFIYRLNQLQNEQDELRYKYKSNEITIEEYKQGLDEIGQDIESTLIYAYISPLIFLIGFSFVSMRYRYKRFEELKKQYLNLLGEEPKLSLIVESQEL